MTSNKDDLVCAVARAGWITDKAEVSLLQRRDVVECFVEKTNERFGEEVYSVMAIDEYAKLRGIKVEKDGE